ncbi:hypothetical protein HMI49_40265 [Corallococcus exercitus]|uniref:Uncharacterized protein n=1 Tax=Corallococcus exercitus TaxID=2316736 RepID=A0A7Y4KSX8_9BACT|nr:hypothetical protein [Corallococcus exercitus]NOK39423.1 hypothetical protein [Corallococcus exercitus]
MLNALKAMPVLLRSYKTPMARFVTDREGWIIEVEHLEEDGERRLRDLLAAGRQVAGALEYRLDGLTGMAGGRQYFIGGLRNGTYVKNIVVRTPHAPNVF